MMEFLAAVLVCVVLSTCSHLASADCSAVPLLQRVDCGYPGIPAEECRAKGCCFDNTQRGIWCFVAPKEPEYFSSCKEILNNDASSSSGEYTIKTSAQQLLTKVYCEMGLNGGGYTFIQPSDLTRLSDSEIQAMFTDKSSFLMRIKKTDGTQPYGVLQQLDQYGSIPLKVSLSDNTEYATPQNAAPLGTPFLYYGFLPKLEAAKKTVQGLKVNGANLTFTNCDANPNSYIALFPNIAELTPTNKAYAATFPFCDSLLSGSLALDPSHRVLPDSYFMFLETHWGGCGCYTQTDGRLLSKGIISGSIGFR